MSVLGGVFLYFASSLFACNFSELSRYALIDSLQLPKQAKKPLEEYQPETGFSKARFRILIDNPQVRVWLLLPDKEIELFSRDGIYFENEVGKLEQGTPYRIRIQYSSGETHELIDPGATTFTRGASLKSVYWDINAPGSYQRQAAVPDLRAKYLDILETEPWILAAKYRNGPQSKEATYRFIVESGLIEEIKKLGYNAVEFLPFNHSVEGDSWHYRYQTFGLFGPSSRYGTPEEFRMMIDAFNRAGILVIMDSVIGHYPDAGGIHLYKKADGRRLFGETWSPWGTRRYDYENPFIRKYLIDSILENMKQYGIGGIRVDNLDGVRFEPGGTEFLRELSQTIRDHLPQAILIGEMFFGEKSVLERAQDGGLGFDYRNHSDLFDFFKDYLLKYTDEIDMNKLRDAIRNPWAWGEVMRFHYLTTHDESANGRGNATGAYPATLIKGHSTPWEYVEKKTRVFGALSKLAGSSSLDLLQMRILQEGTFYTNPEIQWELMDLESQGRTKDFFATLSWAIQNEPAFAPQNLHGNIENHTDYHNKVISLERVDCKTGKRFYALLNLGHKGIENYRFGVVSHSKYKVVVDSERLIHELTSDIAGEHGKPHSLNVPYLAPYHVLLFEEVQ